MRARKTTQLSIPQGATWNFAWPIVTPEGEPVDLTGWSARAQVRPFIISTDVLHEWSSEVDTILFQENRLVLACTPSISSAWEWTEGVYDVEATDTDGAVWRVAEGKVYVRPEVTR
jgi:hypothetical protein